MIPDEPALPKTRDTAQARRAASAAATGEGKRPSRRRNL